MLAENRTSNLKKPRLSEEEQDMNLLQRLSQSRVSIGGNKNSQESEVLDTKALNKFSRQNAALGTCI